MNRTVVIVGAVVAAVLIACTVVLVIVVSNLTAAQKEADYRACLADSGMYDAADIDQMVGVAEGCQQAVYGD